MLKKKELFTGQFDDFVKQKGDKMMERKMSILLGEKRQVIRTLVYEKARELTEEELSEIDRVLVNRIDWGTSIGVEDDD